MGPVGTAHNIRASSPPPTGTNESRKRELSAVFDLSIISSCFLLDTCPTLFFVCGSTKLNIIVVEFRIASICNSRYFRQLTWSSIPRSGTVKEFTEGQTLINYCLLYFFLSVWIETMAGKLLILCFVLAMITIATCKPRLNPFSGLFRRGKLARYKFKLNRLICCGTLTSSNLINLQQESIKGKRVYLPYRPYSKGKPSQVIFRSLTALEILGGSRNDQSCDADFVHLISCIIFLINGSQLR